MIAEPFMQGARRMGLNPTEMQARKVALYHELLVKNNEKQNLTRIQDDPVARNYLDSAALLLCPEIAAAKRIADVGSGAGLPGIILSILHPEAHVVMIDSLDKRVRFLNEVIGALSLNAEALHLRAERAGQSAELRESFDAVTARGVAELNLLSEYLFPLARVGGTVAAMKGKMADGELERAQNAIATLGGGEARILPVHIPERDWSHCIVCIAKDAPTPARYPRREGICEKRPL